MQIEEDAAREEFLKLSPEDKQRTREWGERFKKSIDAGEFTLADFLEGLRKQGPKGD